MKPTLLRALIGVTLAVFLLACPEDNTAEEACKAASCPFNTDMELHATSLEECSATISEGFDVTGDELSISGKCTAKGDCVYSCTARTVCCSDEKWVLDPDTGGVLSYTCGGKQIPAGGDETCDCLPKCEEGQECGGDGCGSLCGDLDDDGKFDQCPQYGCALNGKCLNTCIEKKDCHEDAACTQDDKCKFNAPDGSVCGSNNVACKSGHCQNNYCCATGTCCQADIDCPGEGMECSDDFICVGAMPAGSNCDSDPEIAYPQCQEGLKCACVDPSGKTDPNGDDCKGSETGVCCAEGAENCCQSADNCGASSFCESDAMNTRTCENGTCGQTLGDSCGTYSCKTDGSSCETACNDVSQCSSGNDCLNNECKVAVGTGAACKTTEECAGSLICGSGVCCNDGNCCPTPGSGDECTVNTCIASTLSQTVCSDAYQCTNVGEVIKSCGNYNCNETGTECKIICDGNDDCIDSYYCNLVSGSCAAQLSSVAGDECIPTDGACGEGLGCKNGYCCNDNNIPCCVADDDCNGMLQSFTSASKQSSGDISADSESLFSVPVQTMVVWKAATFSSTLLAQVFTVPNMKEGGYIKSITLGMKTVSSSKLKVVTQLLTIAVYEYNSDQLRFDWVANANPKSVASINLSGVTFFKPEFTFDNWVKIEKGEKKRYLIVTFIKPGKSTDEKLPDPVSWFKTICKNGSQEPAGCDPIQGTGIPCDSFSYVYSGTNNCQSSEATCGGNFELPEKIDPNPDKSEYVACLDDTGDFYFQVNYVTDYCDTENFICMGTP